MAPKIFKLKLRLLDLYNINLSELATSRVVAILAVTAIFIRTYKRVDGLETSLHGLVHGLSWDDTWGLQLNSLAGVGLDWSLSVDSVTEWVDDTSEETVTDGHIDDGSGSLDDITLLDLSVGEAGKTRR